MTRPPAANLWDLDPDVAHLNHGSFGATPRAVLEAQTAWRQEIEVNPVRFFDRTGMAHLDHARTRLAEFIGARPERLAFVRNASTGVNAVLRSLRLRAGDELLVTDHGYGAAVNAVRYVADRAGASTVVARVGMPVRSPDEVVAAITGVVTARTRLAVVDHVTSPTAIVFPIGRIVAELGARGVPVLVDGAHAPGMLDLDVTAIGADYYTGNCHKWMCAPKAAGFLWVRNPDAAELVPLVVGWGRSGPPPGRSQFHADFDWVGTDDPTAYLAVPTAIDLLGGLFPGGWAELRRRNHELALTGRDQLLAALRTAAPVPDDMLGSMAVVPLPPGDADAMRSRLAELGFEVPITSLPGYQRPWLRISAQAYNSLEDYTRLAEAVSAIQ